MKLLYNETLLEHSMNVFIYAFLQCNTYFFTITETPQWGTIKRTIVLLAKLVFSNRISMTLCYYIILTYFEYISITFIAYRFVGH